MLNENPSDLPASSWFVLLFTKKRGALSYLNQEEALMLSQLGIHTINSTVAEQRQAIQL